MVFYKYNDHVVVPFFALQLLLEQIESDYYLFLIIFYSWRPICIGY